MKLKAYSQNSPTRHLIFLTAKRFLWLPIVILALSAAVFIGSELLLKNRYSLLAAKFNFLFNSEEVWAAFPYFLILISAFSAYVMFAFLFKKKSATMMMLTGVSRTTLFMTRYLFGLLSTLIPTLTTFIILLAMGAGNVNKSISISENTALLILSVVAIIVYSYTVATIAAALCGRAIEFFAVCAVFYFGAQGLLLFIGAVLSSFMHGFAYPIRGEYNLPYSLSSLFDKYSHLSINTIFKYAFNDYISSGYNPPEPISLSAYASELIWLIVITLALIPLAAFIFKIRNSEFDGKSNANRILSTACTIIIALSLSSLVLFGGNTLPFILGALALFIVLCIAFYAFFNGTARKMLGAVKFALPSVAVIIIFGAISYGDLFGYSQKIPDLNEIESVKLTYKGDMHNYLYVGKHTSGYGTLRATYINYGGYISLESENDIKTAIDIHQALIEDGSLFVSNENQQQYSDTIVYSDFYVIYTLKDGSEVIRCYPKMKLSTLYTTLRIEDTEAYEEAFGAAIMEFANGSTIAFSDSMMSSLTFPELTDEDKTALVTALAEDRANADYKQLYHPEEECIGVIWLSGSTEANGRYYPKDPVYIYKTSTETLNWLEGKGLMNLFEQEYTVKSIELFEINYYASNNMNSTAIDRYFSGEYNYDTFASESTTKFIKEVPSSEFDLILEKCRLQYFTDSGNKYAVITLVNSAGEEIKTVKFLVE